MKATRFFTALALVFSAAGPNAFDVTPPPVPDNLLVPAGNRAFLITHAVGTQSYICLPAGNKAEWTFVGPQATLFDDQSEQVLTHFLSPNPDESGLPRPTWQHSRDTSAVWAQRVDSAPAPIAGAIPWLLLEIVGEEDGPTGGDKVTRTTFIQRVNTTGGAAPATGCKVPKDLYKTTFVPYTSDYVFYQADTE